MTDISLTADNTSTYDPPMQEEGVMVVAEEAELRPRRSKKEIPKLEEVNSKYKDLILTLPAEQKWAMRQYNGYWQWEILLPGFLRMQEDFKPHHNDIILASFPKSGTTWLKALVFTIVHRDKYTFSHHPLLKLNPHDCERQLEDTYSLQDEQVLEILPSPRVLGTHAPYTMLPESVKTSKCRIIYICREPKDVLVSFWHMMKRLDWLTEPLSFAQSFELFCTGRVPYGPIWDHVVEYFKKSVHDPDKILFLKYEEMMKDPMDSVIRIAKFSGHPFSEEEAKRGAIEEIVRFCSFDKLKHLDVNKKDGIAGTKNDYYFRKAVVGDWQNHMNIEMAGKLDEIVKEKLKGSGFTYRSS